MRCKKLEMLIQKGFHIKGIVKVSKYQKHFFLKLHCPKDERNIRQNYALACFIRQNFVQYFVTFVFWENEFQEKLLLRHTDLKRRAA